MTFTPKSAALSSATEDHLPLVMMVCEIVHKISGIQLGEKQYNMVQSRLYKRILELQLSGPKEYLSYIEKNKHTESSALVSLLTTHHTFFFREFDQFELVGRALPEILKEIQGAGRKTLRIWSMACSRGQEVYSLAMYFDYQLKALRSPITFEIMGTDIDKDSVAIAKNGVYRWDDIKSVPANYLADHWARGTDEIADFVKVKKAIRERCRFDVGNLLDLPKQPITDKFDIVFCRNAFIYFSPQDVKQISENIIKRLTDNGMFMVGISETLNGLGLPLQFMGNSTYRNISKQKTEKTPIATAQVISMRPEPTLPVPTRVEAPIRVMCVDDSPTVLALLKSILKKDSGFEIVAIAKNGLEAAKILKQQPVDVMTLDIHMPEQNGVDYLAANFNSSHPPVIMVSSVSREDSGLGLRALELGAHDYVEKPTVANLADRTDELRMKIRSASQAKKGHSSGTTASHELTRSFAKQSRVENPDKTLRIIVGSLGDRDKIINIYKQATHPIPPTILAFECADSLIENFVKKFSTDLKKTLTTIQGKNTLFLTDQNYVTTTKQLFEQIQHAKDKRISFLVFADVGSLQDHQLSGFANAQVIFEEIESSKSNHKMLRSVATKLIPYTSFLFDSDSFLNMKG